MNRKNLLMRIAMLMLTTMIGLGIVYAGVSFTGTYIGIPIIHTVKIEAGDDITARLICTGSKSLNPRMWVYAPSGIQIRYNADDQTGTAIDCGGGKSSRVDFIAAETGIYTFLIGPENNTFGSYELIVDGTTVQQSSDSGVHPWIPDSRLNPDMAAGVATYVDQHDTLYVYALNDEGLSYLALAMPFNEIVCEVPPPQSSLLSTLPDGSTLTCLPTGEVQLQPADNSLQSSIFPDVSCTPATAGHREIAAGAHGLSHLYCLDTGEIQLNINKGHEELVYVWDQMPPTTQTTYVYDTTTGERLSQNTRTIAP